MVSERCEKMVCVHDLMFTLQKLKYLLNEFSVGKRCCKSITHSVKLSRSKITTIYSHIFHTNVETTDSNKNKTHDNI